MSRLRRLFTIKTRFEAFLVIYAIALGAVERGQHYLATYPGVGGWLLFAACTGTVFIAGAKLLDAVRLEPASKPAALLAPARRRSFRRHPLRSRPLRSGTRRLAAFRKD